MTPQIFPDSNAVAKAAALLIASEARQAVAARGRFIMAVSGGKTPWQMLRELAHEEVPWFSFHIVQVDERIAPAGDPDRNLTHLRESLLSHAPIPPEQIHAMPVEAADPEKACLDYTGVLNSLCGNPPIIDLVHLGLGPDGHTASLIPGDAVCQVHDREVALTGLYQNRRRQPAQHGHPERHQSQTAPWHAVGAEALQGGLLLRCTR